MDGFRDGDDRRRPTPPRPRPENDATTSSARLEEVGDLHFHAAAYSSAVDYYRSALRARRPDGAGADEVGLRVKLADCHRLQGAFDEAARELEQARRGTQPDDDIGRAVIEVRLARVLQGQGRFAEALDLALEAFGVLSMTDRHADVGSAQMVLGIAHACTGRVQKAQEFFEDALGTFRRIGDVVSQAHVFNNLALLSKRACRWTRALQLYTRAEELFRSHGATYECDVLLLNQAVLYRKMGQRAEARATAVRGIARARSRGDQADLTRLLLLSGQLDVEDRRFAEAERALLEAKVLAERQDMIREMALADEFLGDLMRATERFAEAAANYDLAIERARTLSDENDVVAEVRRRQAELALQLHRPAEAVELAEEGLGVAERVGEDFERGFLHRAAARARALEDDTDAAVESFRRAVDAFGEHRLTTETADTLRELAELHLRRGTSEDALLARARVQEALRLRDSEGVVDAISLHLALARAELALDHHDEAMIALFELERLAGGDTGEAVRAAEILRREIEDGVARRVDRDRTSLHELVDLPDHVSGLSVATENGRESLQRLIDSSAEQLGADRAVLALVSERGRVEVLGTRSMPRTTARELVARAHALLEREHAPAARVWSDMEHDPDWSDLFGARRGPLASAVAFPLVDRDAAGGSVAGVLYFDASAADDRLLPFDAEALAVVSAGAGVLYGELSRPTRDVPIDTTEGPAARVITGSRSVEEVLALCAKVAPSPYTVLLTGETGTGKGLLAGVIHELSPRRRSPLVPVNCAAIPETLLESELFGHVRGAFTGAERDEEGLIASADGGTLFLDEVGKMPLTMQAKLLHFLDDRQIRPVGGRRARAVDVRVICATKRDLRRMVEQGEFLEDLYYRLTDFPIDVPPLRERGDDVLLLADTFLRRTCDELGRPVPRLTRGAARRLEGYRWPGNVRELEKVIRRVLIMAGDEERLRQEHLPEELRGPADPESDDRERPGMRPLREQIAELERRAVQTALDEAGWNRSEAARRLKVSYPTLLQKIRVFGLTPDS
jgi:transcriptional regulator with GAF, ATPase, and Fis domain